MAAAPDVKAECERLGSLVADTASYGHRWAIDLLLSALAAAAGSYRRSTATTPFPDALFSAGPDGGRDYAALLQALQALPPTSWMATGGATGMGTAGCYEDAAARAFQERLSAQQRGLLLWLLEHPRCRLRSVRRVGLTSVQAALPRLTGWVADIGMNPSLRPSAVFCLEDVPDDVGQHRGRILAFHGTRCEAWVEGWRSRACLPSAAVAVPLPPPGARRCCCCCCCCWRCWRVAPRQRACSLPRTSWRDRLPAPACGPSICHTPSTDGSMENLHSILHNGLVNASGTRLERTGAWAGGQLPSAAGERPPPLPLSPPALRRRSGCAPARTPRPGASTRLAARVQLPD